MLRNRLFWQIWLLSSGLTVVGVAVLYGVFAVSVERAYYGRAEANLHEQLPLAAILARGLLFGSLPVPIDQLPSLENGTRLTVIRSDGLVVFDSLRDATTLQNHGSRPEILAATSTRTGQASRFSETLGKELLYVAIRIDDDDGAIGYVRVATAVDSIDERMRSLRGQLSALTLMTIAILLTISYALSKRFYRPITEAAEYARRLAEGNYGARLPGVGNGDIALLQHSLNDLARTTEERVQRLEENRHQLAAVLSALKEGVIAINAEQRILHLNTAAAELLSISDDVIGKPLWEVVRTVSLTTLVDGVLAAGHSDSTVANISGKVVEITADRLSDGDQPNDRLIIVLQDVTERHRIESMRVDFVANASHELKTPLSAIRGMVETIIDDAGMATDVREEFLNRISRQVNRLGRIVSDLLQLSRFDRFQQDEDSLVDLDLNHLVSDAVAAQTGVAAAREVSLRFNPRLTPLRVRGNPESLLQLVTNLLDNAIKYSGAGTAVEVTTDTELGHALVSVADQGPGITPEHQNRIFERFYRIDPARSRELGGTGLGLAIVKHIAGSHHGSVAVDSQPGHGSTFTLRLPLSGSDPDTGI